MYVAGANTKIGGNGVMNANSLGLVLRLLGTAVEHQHCDEWQCRIHRDHLCSFGRADARGGGSTRYDFVGATITGSVKMNGHFQFHYDEALKGFGPRRGYAVTSWEEASLGGSAPECSAGGARPS
jgi:hypothetical protein